MRNKLFLLLKFAVSFSLIGYFYTNTDFSEIMGVFSDIEPTYYALGFILNYLGGITSQSIITKLTTNSLSISLLKMDIINLGMRFYSMVLPLSIVSVIRWQRYTTLGLSKTDAFLLMVLNKSLQILFISLFLFLGLLVFDKVIESSVGVSNYKLFISISILVFSFFLVLSLGLMRRFNVTFIFSLIQWISQLFPANLEIRLQAIIERLRLNILNTDNTSNRKLFNIFAISAVGFLLIVSSQYYFALSLNIHIGVLAIFFARSFVQLLMMVPISIAGLGLRELGFVTALSFFSVAHAEALALALILFSMQILFGVIGAMFEVIHILRTSFTTRVSNDNSGN